MINYAKQSAINGVKIMKLFYIQVTDVFAGEANYAWATNHLIKGKSTQGAVNRFSRLSGLRWRYNGLRYNSSSGATCFFIEEFDPEFEHYPKFTIDDRK